LILFGEPDKPKESARSVHHRIQMLGTRHGMEGQNSKFESLLYQFERLEDQVHFLDYELPLLRREVQEKGKTMHKYIADSLDSLEVPPRKQAKEISFLDSEDVIGEEKTYLNSSCRILCWSDQGVTIKLNIVWN